MIKLNSLSIGLMLLICISPLNNVWAKTAAEPFALHDVTLLDGPFKEAQQIDREYILTLDPNRLLAPFLKEAGLPTRAPSYPDWESGGLGGHTGGHYLTALAQMVAATGEPKMSRRLDFIISELARCQQKNGNGYIGGVPNGRELWQQIAAGDIRAENFSLNGHWVPLYNLHKLWAGLRDAYQIAGILQAKEMLIKLTDWWIGVVDDLSDEQIQSMLQSEHGGLNEVFADVYAITGDEKYLNLARRFCHRQILNPLSEKKDCLTGLHANTQIPKVVGFERISQLCDKPSYHQAAGFFWEVVTTQRSVAFGGNSVREHFNPVDDFRQLLEERQGPETCNTYNMLRLSELLFYTRPEARYADYYERGLFNHILSSQHPTRPGFVYFTPIRPCHYRVYSQPEKNFWCCVGSGMESHGKYGKFIYAHSDDELYMNLFMASQVTWHAKGLTLRQETAFPDEARTRLKISADKPVTLTLQIRYPAWVAPGKIAIKVDGRPVAITSKPSSYVPLQRTWQQGDQVDIDIPMQTRLERLGGDCDYAAIMCGPIVLAMPTGQDNMDGLFAGEGRWVHIPNGPLVPLNQAPMLVSDDLQSIPDNIQPVPGKPMTFSAASVIRPQAFANRRLIPFFRVHKSRYMMYWRLVTPARYENIVQQLKAEEQAGMVQEQNTVSFAGDKYQIKAAHPRLFIEDVRELAARCDGPLADDYKLIKQRADNAVKAGRIQYLSNAWSIPEDLMNCGIVYLVERQKGHDAQQYAEVIIKEWGDGSIISNPKGSHFGYHAIAYDWIFDALTPEQRVRFGDALGTWLRYFTNEPRILLKWGHWEYNQTWGPIHLNVMNCRDAITQKLLIALAIKDEGTKYQADAKTFLDSWAERVPSECIPAFNKMGGVWSESYGHGAYGPVTVIPYAFAAWRTASGIDLFKQLKPWGYPVESPRWIAYTMMPHNERTAWIDDGNGSRPAAFARAAPMLRDGLSQWFSDRGRDWLRARWQRVACYDPSIKATGPDTLPLGYLFPGAGHVYMRSAWNDPNTTWAFFGCGPQFAGHSRDDEGHFLICKQGALVSRQGGQGHNDDDYYAGGSLIFNIATIFDPNEKLRRDKNNENDGGLLRHVYEGGPFPRERGHIVAFEHNTDYTYAAADITKGYNEKKAREVTRQFLYLRGKREFFVVFDRLEATRPDYARHFFLHVPTEPKRQEDCLTWSSLPEADGDKNVLSYGKSRMFMHTLLPDKAQIVIRGGPGKKAWGHPLEETAQYNHTAKNRMKPPVCPWRIEVGDPGDGSRSLFLHVFEITDEKVHQPTDVKFVPPAGVDIAGLWQVRFNPTGPLGGTAGEKALTTSIKTEKQYQ